MIIRSYGLPSVGSMDYANMGYLRNPDEDRGRLNGADYLHL